MADSLELVGVKGVRKQTGTEMSIIRPLRGGDTHQVKEWWRKSVNTTYATCTIFKVTTGDGTVKLALPTGKFETTNVKIIHDGNFNFTFTAINELDRAALFTENMELIEHYIFPSISGGQIVTVTPPGAADRPNAAPPVPDTTIDSVTVSAGGAATSGESVVYSAAVTGDATPFTYLWGVSAGGSITAGQGTTSATVLWNATGAQGVTCSVSSTNANFDGNDVSDTLNVTVAAPAPATGPADSVTLVGDTTTQASGSVAATATTSANGSGLTVTYDSDGSTATNLAIAAAGSGYQEGDSFTVDGDTGVTGTVSIASILTTNVAQADVSHVVTQAGGYYYIDGVQQAEVTANAGETIYFDLSDSSLSGHPFKIYTDATKTTEVTVGVASDANGLIFTPPIAGSFSYQCAAHAGMGGDITISA